MRCSILALDLLSCDQWPRSRSANSKTCGRNCPNDQISSVHRELSSPSAQCRAPGRPGDGRMPQGSGLRRLSRTVGRLQQGFTIGGKGSDGHFAWQQSSGANVRFGSIADMRGTILNDNRQRFLIPARNRMAVRILSACAASAACGASACAVFCAARTTLSRSTAGPLGKL